MSNEGGKIYGNTPTSILYPLYLGIKEYQACSIKCEQRAISLMKCLTLL